MRHAAALFVASLLVRAVHWLAAPDRTLPWGVEYQGDAPYWQQIANGTAGLEAVLPFRPPAMGWLVQAVWDGQGSALLPRAGMVLLGAAIAPLFYLALRRALPERIALVAGWICALSHSLTALGSGLHVETPYLLLFVATLFDTERLRTGPSATAAVRFGALHALACLFRVDHVLCFLATLAWLAWQRRGLRNLAIATATFALALLPWQLHVRSVVNDLDEGRIGAPAPALPPAGSPPWDQDAIAAVRALPPFAQGATAGFVAATIQTRGGKRVTAADLRVVEEAYGCYPERVHTPWLALYGPLNFFLANCPESDGGFTRAALDRRPPFAGGLERYPRGILEVLPRELELGYPPHLHAVNHGYALGFAWIASDPAGFAALAWRKLLQAWRGAATGFGATNLPLGRSGTREPVDVLVADGIAAAAWRAMLLVLALFGLLRLSRERAVMPLLLWFVTRTVVVVLFFGYARLGALAVPSLAVAWAAAIVPLWERANSRHRAMTWGLAILVAGIDLACACATTRAEVAGGIGPHARAVVRY